MNTLLDIKIGGTLFILECQQVALSTHYSLAFRLSVAFGLGECCPYAIYLLILSAFVCLRGLLAVSLVILIVYFLIHL